MTAMARPMALSRIEVKPAGPGTATGVVERARTGDAAAMRAIYEQHAPAVLRRLRWLTGDAALAEDLCQDTFARAWVAMATLRDETAIEPWLHGIAFNRARTVQSKRRRRQRLRQALAPAPDGPAADVDVRQAELIARLDAALQSLSSEQRAAFVLRNIEAVPLREAAEILGASVATVSYRAKAAETLVRAAFEEEQKP